ncbi:MAG TPA: AgmX/PglI C-terminal domain-containing protein [Gammaproteobacteria bacterium]
MAQAAVLYRVYDLPWAASDEQEERFRKILRRTLGIVVALALLLSLLPVPEPDPAAIEEIPPRLARLVIEEPEPPPPPPVVQEPPQQLEPAPEPEPVAEEPVPEPEPAEPTPEAVEPTPAEPPVDRTVQARERARGAGLLPFASQLAALRDEEVLDALGAAETETVRPGPAGAGSAVPERSLITSRAGRGSGGIDTAALSRDTGGGGLAGRATTEVESPVAGLAPAGGGPVARGDASDRPSRSREEIERVFDQNKGAIYALYNRALRQNPALQGKLVLRLTIAPDGRVTSCEVVSSELNDPELERRLVQRVMLFQFEPKDVAPVTTTKPIDFFPA